MKILVTGMSGLIGEVVRKQLEEKHELSALNRSDVPGVSTHRASIDDLEAIQPAFEGQDQVVHLAAHAGETEWETLLHANVIGTYNVFEAARRAGVKRIVFASSGSTVAGWEQEEPYRSLVTGSYEDAPPSWPMIDHNEIRPNGIYASSKVWGEALARHYAEAYGISILCLRIGLVNREDRPTSPRQYSVWCSQRDIGRMVELCIEAPEELRYDVFYVLSNNRWSYRDLAHASAVLGFKPEDEAEAHR